MRRTIAEDSEWNLATIPDLTKLCLSSIVKNFANNPVLKDLLPQHQSKVLEELDVRLPLSVTANLIEDQGYWKRCFISSWGIADESLYDHDWKRMYFEKNLEGHIENFIPGTTDPSLLNETLKLSGKFIKRLEIKQLLPPIKVPQQNLNDSFSDCESDSEDNVFVGDHFDINILVKFVPCLNELSLYYGVQKCGMNFEWNLFEFTMRDCSLLAKALPLFSQLTLFQLCKSKVDDVKARVIIKSIIDHPTLKTLDFSHNKLGDKSARAIGKLLNNHSHLVKLDLKDNHISGAGAAAIAYAIELNSTLKFLNLQLNQLQDSGCQSICKALLINQTLTHLHLGSNGISEVSIDLLCQVVLHNKTLLSLNLSCNSIKEKAGISLQEALMDNSSLVDLDLRLCDVSIYCLYNINQHLKANSEKKKERYIKQFTY
ncbi:dynein regulatory complex subunit 5 isoform X1 [Hydra vulgaris]|uniref:dynein regulatory complex subunit 5 isoform X1 n=1 Tax=Hydra vulgaris TaxID=6087 RepID=UPI001F5E9B23|nr:dynein regulatory complex subunit 5 isoform X2 [Hydra vulgaris]XP_047138678.1 dynein regulatory complex subunit 5 isoform X2 [Hydra vulgaris]